MRKEEIWWKRIGKMEKKLVEKKKFLQLKGRRRMWGGKILADLKS